MLSLKIKTLKYNIAHTENIEVYWSIPISLRAHKFVNSHSRSLVIAHNKGRQPKVNTLFTLYIDGQTLRRMVLFVEASEVTMYGREFFCLSSSHASDYYGQTKSLLCYY